MTFTKLLAAVLMVAAVIASSNAPASAQVAPSISVDHAACYRSIVDDDDLFCLGRYELPESVADGVSDAWCAELVNQDGCDGTPADPTEPTSLPPNTVFITLYDGCTAGDCSAGTILNVSRVPRIGTGLGGSYMTAGHTVTWGDTDTHLCLESSDDPAVFATTTIDCIPVFWNGAANVTADQREALGEDMVTQVLAIGILDSLPSNAYVQNGLINGSGKTFALEALDNADRLLDVFAEKASLVALPGLTPVANSTVQASINASTANVQAAKTDFGNNVLGISADGTGVLISLVVTIAIFVLVLSIGKNIVFALISAMSAASVMVVFGFLPFQVMAVLIVLLALPAAYRVVRTVSA